MAKSITGPKKTAWDAFAQWVKVKGCLETTGHPFAGRCITCGKRFHIRALQAGHLIPNRTNGVLFNEELVNTQCVICNERHHGRPKKYREVMVATYGEKKVAQWELEARKPIYDRDMDFPAITQKYRTKTKELLLPFNYSTYSEMLKGHQT